MLTLQSVEREDDQKRGPGAATAQGSAAGLESHSEPRAQKGAHDSPEIMIAHRVRSDHADEVLAESARGRSSQEFRAATQRMDATDGRASAGTLSFSTSLSASRDGELEPFDTMNASTLATHSYCNSLDMSRIGTVPG